MTKTIEEIYPLTIVNMRFGDYIVIFNCNSYSGFVRYIEDDQDINQHIKEYLEENVFFNYGIGKTLVEAFVDYQERELKNDEIK